jgi:hypothetical protein
MCRSYAKIAAIFLICALSCCKAEQARMLKDAPLIVDLNSCDIRIKNPTSIQILHAGEVVTVTGREYGKDYMCVHVKAATGATGYVLAGPEIEIAP